MAPILDDFVAARPNTSDGARACRENPAVEDGIPAAPGERRMRGIKGYDVRAGTCPESDDRLRERLGATSERGVE